MGEAILLSLLGVKSSGLGIARLLQFASDSQPATFFRPVVNWQVVAGVLVMALVVGAFAALVPALTASRRNIVESLRFTG